MEQHLKKRVLGAFVTVIAIAIALPIVLDGSRNQIGLSSEVPPMPETPDWAYVEDGHKVRVELEQLASGEAEEQIAIPDSRVVEHDDPLPPDVPKEGTALDSNNIPYAWTLQLGAFSDEKNASTLRDKLRGKGYKAYTRNFPGDKLIRVYVGPEVQRSDIEALQKKLQSELNQKVIPIKRYDAES